MKILTILSIGLLTVASLSSCKKEVVGPKGETGAQGIQGPSGSANVTVQNVSINPGNWSTTNAYNLYFNTAISIPTTDACMVYVSTNNSSFTPLPAVAFYQNGDQFSFSYSYQHYLQLSYYNPNGAAGKITQTLYFRVINIPSTGLIQNPDLDLRDYEAVKEIFNL